MTGKMRAAKTIAKARITKIYESYRRKIKTKTVHESVEMIESHRVATADASITNSTITLFEIDPIPAQESTEVRKRSATEQSTIATPHAGAFFRGYCFAKLRNGQCLRQKCRFHHNLSMDLRNLCSRNEKKLNEVIIHATHCKFVYFIGYIYPAVLSSANLVTTVGLFHKFIKAGLMTNPLMKLTISMLKKRGMSQIKFMEFYTAMIIKKRNSV